MITPHADIARFMQVLFDEARRSGVERPIFEVRIPKGGRDKTISGYFDNAGLAASAIATRDGTVEAIYVTPNPTHVDCFARAANRLQAYAEATTTDTQIARREWLLVDVDSVRPKGVSSTDAQHIAALARAREIRQHLTELGWPLPITADSGNGAHLMYRIDAPNDAETTELIKGVLEALGRRFDDPVVKVDTTVFNASRIWKVYGTMACKGDDLPEQPHRRAALLDIPPELEICTLDGLRVPAWTWPPTEPAKQAGAAARAADFDLRDYLAKHAGHLSLGEEKKLDGGGWIREIYPCPWGDHEKDRAAYVGQRAGGAIIAGCRHERCKHRRWSDLRDLIDPTWNRKTSNRSPPHTDDDSPRFGRPRLVSDHGAPSEPDPDGPESEKEPERAKMWRTPTELVDEIIARAGEPWVCFGIDGEELARLRLGSFGVISGGPGSGKSTLTAALLAEHARLHGPAPYLSLEMGADELSARIIGIAEAASWEDVLRGRVPRDRMLAALPPRLAILDRDTDDVTLAQLDAIVAKLRADHGDQPVLAAVDYVQLAAGNGIDVRAKNAETVEIIRRAAKRLRIVLLGISQPSRAAGNALRKGEMVGIETMGASAETAAFERGAYVTMAIGVTGPEGEDGVKSVEMNIGKGRMGGGDRIVPMRYNGRTGLWRVDGASRPASEVQAERAATKDAGRVQAAMDAIFAALDRSDTPLSRDAIRDATNIGRGVVKAAVEELLAARPPKVIECENANRSKFKLLWTPRRKAERDAQLQAQDRARLGDA